MEHKPEEIIFTSEDGQEVLFRVLEQTKLAEEDYLLVSREGEDGEEEALILKDKSVESDEDAIYELVEDEKEMKLLAKVFEELIGDIEIEIE